jgi:hypothetical protein
MRRARPPLPVCAFRPAPSTAHSPSAVVRDVIPTRPGDVGSPHARLPRPRHGNPTAPGAVGFPGGRVWDERWRVDGAACRPHGAARRPHGPPPSRRSHGPPPSRRSHGPPPSRRPHGPPPSRRSHGAAAAPVAPPAGGGATIRAPFAEPARRPPPPFRVPLPLSAAACRAVRPARRSALRSPARSAGRA